MILLSWPKIIAEIERLKPTTIEAYLRISETPNPLNLDLSEAPSWSDEFHLYYRPYKKGELLTKLMENFGFACFRRNSNTKEYLNEEAHLHLLLQIYLRGEELKKHAKKVHIYDNFGKEIDFDNLFERPNFGYVNAPQVPDIRYIMGAIKTAGGKIELLEFWRDFPFKKEYAHGCGKGDPLVENAIKRVRAYVDPSLKSGFGSKKFH